MKGEEKLWRILQDKLEMLRAGSRLPEALRVGETALELAQRIFPEDHPSLALSYERLGQIHDQQGNHGEAKVLLEKALRIIDAIEPTDQQAIYRLARRLAYLCDVGGQEEEAITHYETAIRAGTPARERAPLRFGNNAQQCRSHLSSERAAKSGRALLPARARSL